VLHSVIVESELCNLLAWLSLWCIPSWYQLTCVVIYAEVVLTVLKSFVACLVKSPFVSSDITFLMIFAFFDPSLSTLWINCGFQCIVILPNLSTASFCNSRKVRNNEECVEWVVWEEMLVDVMRQEHKCWAVLHVQWHNSTGWILLSQHVRQHSY